MRNLQEQDGFTKQNNFINDESRHASRLCASATENAPKRLDEKSDGEDSKMNNIAWIELKKRVPMTYFLKRSNSNEVVDENDGCNVFVDVNDNQHKELLKEDEKEENKEFHTMVHEEVTSGITSKCVKCKRVEMKSNVDTIKVNKSNDNNQEKKKKIKIMLTKMNMKMC